MQFLMQRALQELTRLRSDSELLGGKFFFFYELRCAGKQVNGELPL